WTSEEEEEEEEEERRGLRRGVEQIVEDLEELVEGVRPKLRHLLSESTLKVAKFTAPKRVVPPSVDTSLYSVRVVSDKEKIQLGDPLKIEITVPKSTLKSRDWIGVYPLGDNPSSDVTTRRSNGRWTFIDGSHTTSPSSASTTPPTLSPSLTLGSTQFTPIPGNDKLIRATLTLEGDRVPWKVGVWECRYHFDEGYGVVSVSDAIEVGVEEFEWMSGDGEKERVTERLVEGLGRCFGRPITPSEDLWEASGAGIVGDAATVRKAREKMSKRVVYFVKVVFGIEFSERVVEFVRTGERFGERIYEAREVLTPTAAGVAGEGKKDV
ncbi:phosphatidylethanolamine N-methyltransferase, partial [Rhizophlyctis rosea]